MGEVDYELAWPPGLSGVHPVFHVSMLKKYHGDGNYIIQILSHMHEAYLPTLGSFAQTDHRSEGEMRY